MHSKHLGAYLAQASDTNSLMPQAKRLIELRKILAEALPESLAKNAALANIREGKIVIFAANNSVAAKLKLLRSTLIERLSSSGLQVTALEVEVQPPEPAAPARHKGSQLTENARLSLRELADQLPESELRNAVSALAKNKVSRR